MAQQNGRAAAASGDDRFAGDIVTTKPPLNSQARQLHLNFAPTDARPVITGIRRRAYGKAAWLVSIKGVCTDTPIRDRKLRRYRRFCAAIKYRFGVTFDPMPQADWSVVVELAIAEAGAS
jgi:hypothetical protein